MLGIHTLKSELLFSKLLDYYNCVTMFPMLILNQ